MYFMATLWRLCENILGKCGDIQLIIFDMLETIKNNRTFQNNTFVVQKDSSVASNEFKKLGFGNYLFLKYPLKCSAAVPADVPFNGYFNM